MKLDLTPCLPGFQRYFVGRGNVSAQETVRRERERLKQESLGGVISIFSRILPGTLRKRSLERSGSRRRVYTDEATFFGFLCQVLLGNCACGEAVRQIQAWRVKCGLPAQHPNSKAYCDARGKLREESLRGMAVEAGCKADKAHSGGRLWKGRKVKLLDGTSVSMPDTAENQAAFPQPRQQKAGCGFPIMNLAVLVSLATGAVLDWEAGAESEKTLWHRLLRALSAGDILLSDSGFFSFIGFARLARRGVDAVMRHTKCMRLARCDKAKTKWLGHGDRIVQWRRPDRISKNASKEEWAATPCSILLRIIDYTVSTPGFRTSKVTLATTLLDSIAYPPEDLAALYFDRWQIELRIRDIKTTMGMEILRCKSPAMIRKETAMFILAYNLIRNLLGEAASLPGVELHRLSFKAAVQQFNQWLHLLLDSARESLSCAREAFRSFLAALAKSAVPNRPGRSEPRAVKRRRKPGVILSSPRRQMIIRCHDSGRHKPYALIPS